MKKETRIHRKCMTSQIFFFDNGYIEKYSIGIYVHIHESKFECFFFNFTTQLSSKEIFLP